MMIIDRASRAASRRGIALVVVLGMLALMTLLATGFVYFMRTENAASIYYRMEISSRHVLNVALARVLMDLNEELAGEVYPDWRGNSNARLSTNKNDVIARVCKQEFANALSLAVSNMPGGVFVPLGRHIGARTPFLNPSSPDFNDGNENFVVVNITQGSAGWISINTSVNLVIVSNKMGRVWWNTNDRYAKVPLPKWDIVDVDQMTPRTANSGKLVQYAYAVFNASGLLDANFAGASNTLRQLGVSTNEIQLGALTNDFQNAGVRQLFYEERADFGRKYQSIQELFELNDAFITPASHWPEHFTVYSRFPAGQFVPSDALVLTGGVARLQMIETAFKNKLVASNPGRFNAENTKWVFDSLIDYLDVNSVPTNLASPTMELNPMINEIGISNTLVLRPDGSFIYVLSPRAEIIYPFMELPLANNNYRLEVDMQFSAVFTDPRFMPSPTSYSFSKTLTPLVPGPDYRLISPLGGIPPISGTYTNLTASNQNIRILVQISRAQIFDSFNRLVDAVPFPTNSVALQLFFFTPFHEPSGFAVPTAAVASNTTYNLGMAGMECVDPRFNWRRVVGANDFFWKTYRPTNTTANVNDRTQQSLGHVNNCTTSYWATAACSDPFDTMHVPFPTGMNSRALQSVAELGYLPVGKWDTVNLSKSLVINGTNYPPDRIFDVFTLGSNSVARGKINPNTYDPDVLATAFLNLPLDQFPFQNTATVARMNINQARELADLWADGVVQRPVTNYSTLVAHITNLMEDASFSMYPMFSTNNNSIPFRNEALLRNTLGLFDARQNYFFVVMVASEITKGFDAPGENLGLQNIVFGFNSRSALIELWRDPYLVNGQNSLILRNYRLLDD